MLWSGRGRHDSAGGRDTLAAEGLIEMQDHAGLARLLDRAGSRRRTRQQFEPEAQMSDIPLEPPQRLLGVRAERAVRRIRQRGKRDQARFAALLREYRLASAGGYLPRSARDPDRRVEVTPRSWKVSVAIAFAPPPKRSLPGHADMELRR